MHGRDGKCTQSLIQKPERKKLLVTRSHRWEENIKMYFKDVGYRHRYFYFEKGPGTQSDPKFGRRGVVLVIPMPGENVPACVLLRKNFWCFPSQKYSWI
jgi:hypothetical protein